MDRVVDYLVYEQSQVRADRTNRRLWILCIILIVSLLGTNAGWLYYENQYEDVVTTYTQQADVNTNGGGNAYVNNGGNLIYGTDQSKTDSDN